MYNVESMTHIFGKVKYNSKLENKAPLTQWKSQPLTFEQAQMYAEEGWRIGWIVPEGYVVVDVDNGDHPELCAC